MAKHTHWEGGPVCKYTTKRACDDAYADWQARYQVELAEHIVGEGRAKRYERDATVFGQLVQVVAGTKSTITAGDGEEATAPFTRRILKVLREKQDARS